MLAYYFLKWLHHACFKFASVGVKRTDLVGMVNEASDADVAGTLATLQPKAVVERGRIHEGRIKQIPASCVGYSSSNTSFWIFKLLA